MAEPTMTQQILDALSSIYAAMADFSEKAAQWVAWKLTTHLDTDGYEVRGKALDDDDEYAPNLVFRSYSGIEAHSRDGFAVHKAQFPQMKFVDAPVDGVVGAAHDGRMIAAAPTTSVAWTLSSDIPEPEGASRWVCMIHNESTTEAANIQLSGGEITINGALDPVTLAPGESRLVSRKSDGFRVQ